MTDRQKQTHRKAAGSATANVSKARVSENRGAAIQMDNTTSNKQQQQWQLHLPAAVFHMLMPVLPPANATQKTLCVFLCACKCLFQMKWCTQHSVPHGIGNKSHLARLRNTCTCAHIILCMKLSSLLWCFYKKIKCFSVLYWARLVRPLIYCDRWWQIPWKDQTQQLTDSTKYCLWSQSLILKLIPLTFSVVQRLYIFKLT